MNIEILYKTNELDALKVVRAVSRMISDLELDMVKMTNEVIIDDQVKEAYPTQVTFTTRPARTVEEALSRDGRVN